MNAGAAHPLSRRILLAALAAVGVGAVVALLGWQRARSEWFASYLLAWQYWAGFSLGSLSVLLLHNITGGAWGDPVRPALRAAVATLPLVAILFLPIALRPQEIYEWADPYHVGEDPILAHKARYLNVDAFRIRAAIYFGLWFLLQLLVAWQRRRTFVRAERAERRLRRWSGQGLALHGLALTFAAVDWIMSLEPHWFSAIFGVIWFASQGLAALALGIAMASTSAEMRAAGPLDPRRDALHDLGKLLLAFVMFWAYVSFSQFFIIWSGNLPEEVVWYVKRFEGAWGDVALALVALHFVAPMVLLLGRDFKRDPRLLGPLALGLVVAHWLDALWQVGPTASDRRLWLDVGLTLGVGGLWCTMFALSYPRMARAELSREATHG